MRPRTSVFAKMGPVLLVLVLLLPVLAGCFKQDNPASEEKRVLRVAYMYGSTYQNDYLRNQYTDMFEFVNKNIEVEWVPAVDWDEWRYQRNPDEPYQEPNAVEEMIKLINGPNPPDVVMVSYEELQQLVQENMLQPLQPFIERDKFNIDEMVPTVVNGLKEIGNGTLYALSPTFSSNALIYNKKIFQERGVEFPQDNMTWDQIFDLARRVTYGEGNDRVYGFGFYQHYWDDLFWSMDAYVSPLGLRIMDENAEKMLVNSDAWEQVWSKLIGLKQEKILPEPPEYNDSAPIYNPVEGDAFLSGKLAMTLVQYSSLTDIVRANEYAANIDNFEPIEWDVVTVPTHPEAPGKGGSIWLDPIFAISANAQNSEDAWKLIEFINGREWAQVKSRSLNMMVAYEDLIRPLNGLDFNIAAFYSLTPVMSVMNQQNLALDPKIRQHLWQINSIGQMKMQEVIQGNKTVKQALQEWETEGDALLKEIRENPDGAPMNMYRY